jgi:hypothetical protein
MPRYDHWWRRTGWWVQAALLLGWAVAAGASPQIGQEAGQDPAAVARRVVAESIGVRPDAVRIISIQPRAFSDGSLDCPRPGMAYAQVITPGHVVLAEASGRRFDVRVTGDTGRLCHGSGRQATRTPKPPVTSGLASAAAGRARRHLASLLEIPADDIGITGNRPARPGESLPGCQVSCPLGDRPDCGRVITLSAGGRDYQYLVQGGEARPCPALARR